MNGAKKLQMKNMINYKNYRGVKPFATNVGYNNTNRRKRWNKKTENT